MNSRTGKIIIYPFYILMISFLLLSCNAPHDNPFDPNSSAHNPVGTLSGFTGSYYSPHEAIKDVTVLLKPLMYLTYSDGNGTFQFTDLPEGEYMLVLSKIGYASDSVAISLQAFTQKDTLVYLNALPEFINPRVMSRHISDWQYVDDRYDIIFSTRVVDADGERDIDNVFINIDKVSFSDTLDFNNQTSEYFLLIPEAKMNMSLDFLLGKYVDFTATDKAGFSSEIKVPIYPRIVRETPSPKNPINGVGVDDRPMLEWQLPKIDYDHSLKVQVFNYTNNPLLPFLSWQKENISSTESSILVSNKLDAGNYFWVVWIVDEFGNSSRSKQAIFMVQ